MRRGAIASGVLHIAAIAVAVYGLPRVFEPRLIEEQPMLVELVTVGDVTTSQRPKAEPEPAKEEPKPEPPKPEAKPEPKPEPPKPEPPKQLAQAPAPKQKPERPKQKFDINKVAALLDKRLKEQAPEERKPEQNKPEQKKPEPSRSIAELVESALKDRAQPQSAPQPDRALDQPMTMSEIDAIRYQIQRCWSVPAGARDAENLIVRLRVYLNPDGSLQRAPDILDEARPSGVREEFYRAAAESARRAVQMCSPLKNLPVNKYEKWRELTLTFNPRDMLGG